MDAAIPALLVILGGAADHASTQAALRRGGIESGPGYVGGYDTRTKILTTVMAAGATYVVARRHKKLGLAMGIGLGGAQVTIAWGNHRKARD